MTEAATITTILFDLDGVIRHFDPEARRVIEMEAGLEPGSLETAAFADHLLEPLVTGKLTRAEWTVAVGDAVGDAAAAAAWLAQKGSVDAAMLRLIDQLRSAGFTVAILTNGTDTIPAELEELGVTSRVDAVFNTAEIGRAKPDRRAFEAVCQALEVDAATVFFTDDSPGKLTGAIELGMTAEPFVGIEQLRSQLIGLGVLS